jgi:hypothetical protein
MGIIFKYIESILGFSPDCVLSAKAPKRDGFNFGIQSLKAVARVK